MKKESKNEGNDMAVLFSLAGKKMLFCLVIIESMEENE